MEKDYRNTKYCPSLDHLDEKKEKIKKHIQSKHPKAIDMHTYISKNDDVFKVEFMRAYNCKCSYCGVSASIVPKETFEIDHFIYEKSQIFGGKKAAGYMENLVLACHYCNHKKSAFEFKDEEQKLFHPDLYYISRIYERDKMYYIKIAKPFINNKTVNNFYNQLNLGSEIHRIDFLLMNMIGLQDSMNNNKDIYCELGKVIDKLRIKRNVM